MPIFEFICEECGRTFEELVRSASVIVDVRCPKCESTQVHKKISRIAARTSGGIGSDGAFTSGFSSSSSSCGTST